MNEFKASTPDHRLASPRDIRDTAGAHPAAKRVYRDLEFEEDQREHRAAMQQKLMSLHQDVVAIMTNSYEVFRMTVLR